MEIVYPGGLGTFKAKNIIGISKRKISMTSKKISYFFIFFNFENYTDFVANVLYRLVTGHGPNINYFNVFKAEG